MDKEWTQEEWDEWMEQNWGHEEIDLAPENLDSALADAAEARLIATSDIHKTRLISSFLKKVYEL